MRRNLRRTGVLKNKLRTSIVVPTGQPQGDTGAGASAGDFQLARRRRRRAVRLRINSRLTSAIDANASPRKPSVRTRNRSSASAILLVAWLATASGSSSAAMPQPSSPTRISSRPPCSTATSIRVAPASTAFSISSLTTLAGRSITSPAAILLTTLGGSSRMLILSLALVTDRIP